MPELTDLKVGNALILLEPRLGTLGQPPTLLSIARPGRRVITLMQTLGYCARSGRRNSDRPLGQSSMRGCSSVCSSA